MAVENVSFAHAMCSSRLAVLGALLLILLAALEHLKMSRLLGQQLLRRRRQTRRALVLDLVLRDERRLLGLDDARTTLGAGVRGPGEERLSVGRKGRWTRLGGPAG